jgi:hypothetical protein
MNIAKKWIRLLPALMAVSAIVFTRYRANRHTAREQSRQRSQERVPYTGTDAADTHNRLNAHLHEQSLDSHSISNYEAKMHRMNELASKFSSWNLYFGGRRITRRMSTSDIANIFAGWHLFALVAGALVTILWRDNGGLGAALIVGSLFGFGSFLSQFWSQAMDRERDFIRKNLNAVELEELRNLAIEIHKLEQRLGIADKAGFDHRSPRNVRRHWKLGKQ